MRVQIEGGPADTLVIDAAVGPVSSVNGRTGDVTIDAAGIDADPEGAAAAAQTAATAAAAAYTDAEIVEHSAATDPHGDRAYADDSFLPLGGGTLTGPVSGPGTFAVAADGGVTAPSLTLPATATTVSKSLVITAPAGAVSYTVWRAPKACTVVAVRGYRVGGTGTTINAVKNSADLLATDLSLSTAATWMSGPGVQNAAMAAGDSLAIAIRSVTGSPTAVTIQVDLQGA